MGRITDFLGPFTESDGDIVVTPEGLRDASGNNPRDVSTLELSDNIAESLLVDLYGSTFITSKRNQVSVSVVLKAALPSGVLNESDFNELSNTVPTAGSFCLALRPFLSLPFIQADQDLDLTKEFLYEPFEGVFDGIKFSVTGLDADKAYFVTLTRWQQ